MKKYLILIIVFVQLQIVNGQKVNSDCTAADSITAKYKKDADRLALRKILRINSSYKDSTHIPKQWSDTVLNSLIAVYNATALPVRDTIITSFNIHTYPIPDLNNFDVSADSNLSWMQNLHNNNIPSGNNTVDSIMNAFHLQIYGYNTFLNYYPYHTVSFASDSNYNITALAKCFVNIPGVFYSDPNICFGDGNNITDSIYSNYVELIYSLGWGDCPSGCTERRFWKFHVYYDCSVEYIGSYGSPLSNPVSEIYNDRIKIYPNPFKTEINIDNICSDFEYTLYNSLGKIMRKDKTTYPAISNLESLPIGLYLLQIKKKNKIIKYKLIKE
jgi:hypothetical protein